MPLINFIIVMLTIAVLLGLANWVAHKFPVIFNGTVISIMNAVVIIAVVIWILMLFLPIGNLSTIQVGR